MMASRASTGSPTPPTTTPSPCATTVVLTVTNVAPVGHNDSYSTKAGTTLSGRPPGRAQERRRRRRRRAHGRQGHPAGARDARPPVSWRVRLHAGQRLRRHRHVHVPRVRRRRRLGGRPRHHRGHQAEAGRDANPDPGTHGATEPHTHARRHAAANAGPDPRCHGRAGLDAEAVARPAADAVADRVRKARRPAARPVGRAPAAATRVAGRPVADRARAPPPARSRRPRSVPRRASGSRTP